MVTTAVVAGLVGLGVAVTGALVVEVVGAEVVGAPVVGAVEEAKTGPLYVHVNGLVGNWVLHAESTKLTLKTDEGKAEMGMGSVATNLQLQSEPVPV